jgi:hypothetical protein
MVDVGDDREIAEALGHETGLSDGKGVLLHGSGACFNGKAGNSLCSTYPATHVCTCNMT